MTTTTSTKYPENSLIKSDSLGRVRVGKEQREKLLNAFECSSLSGVKFAELHGIKYQTFATWVQKRRREPSDPQHDFAKSPEQLIESLVELEIPSLSRDSVTSNRELVVEHASGLRLTISDSSQAELAAALFNKLNRQSQC